MAKRKHERAVHERTVIGDSIRITTIKRSITISASTRLSLSSISWVATSSCQTRSWGTSRPHSCRYLGFFKISDADYHCREITPRDTQHLPQISLDFRHTRSRRLGQMTAPTTWKLSLSRATQRTMLNPKTDSAQKQHKRGSAEIVPRRRAHVSRR